MIKKKEEKEPVHVLHCLFKPISMKSNAYYPCRSNRAFLCHFAISVVFGEFKSKMKGFSDHVPLLNLALILPSHLNLSEGICFTEITFKISTENKKTNISVAKARDPWSNIETVPNLWPVLINIVCLFT